MLRSEEYWVERQEALQDQLMAKGEKYYISMIQQFEKAWEAVEKDIQSFYARYADENKIDYATAMKELTASERRRWQLNLNDYIIKGRQLGMSDKWVQELENASTTYRVTRLQMIQEQIRERLADLYSGYNKGLVNVAGDIYKDGYYKQIFTVQQGVGYGVGFEMLDMRTIETAVAQPHAGAHFSERIWGSADRLNRFLSDELTQTFIRGDDPKDMIGNMAERFGSSRKEAGRLIMTESAFMSAQATGKAYEELEVEKFQFVASMDEKTCPTCGGLDSSEANKKGFPREDYKSGVNAEPMHANCRCTTIPFFDDLEGDRAARDPQGRTYYVPSSMTYNEWAKERGIE